MKEYLKYMRTALLLVAVLSMGFLISCEEDDENSGLVELLSFGPTGVQHGDDIVFIGNNLNKVTEIDLVGVSIPSSGFKSQTADKIVLTVPETAEEGPVTLKTPAGDIVSKTVLSFEVTVAITGTPAEAKPGTDITITGEYMNWVTEVWFPDGVLVTEFVSASLNELVVTVPMEAVSGTITLIGGGTEPVEVESEDAIEITLPTITGMAPNPAERGEPLTITGTDLDLVAKVQFKGNAEVTDFTSVSETEIVLTLPEEANQGKVTLVTYSGVAVESSQNLSIVGALPPLAPLASVIYSDQLENGWQKWGGWGGGSSDLNSTEFVRMGEKAIKVIFAGGWGGPMQFGGATTSTTGRTEFAISIYGGAGTGGKNVNLIVKNGGDATEKQLTITEGEWVEFKIPLSELGSYPQITEMFLQDRDWSGTLYVDFIGLR